ncbi:protein of unknown function UPF0052 and CofD [Aminomonas paucivorans DSM 12260]|uniref:Putative gluconeogenesis factor n=1 Tax=Aminomonas paucivorans DSM 12260 TaxID=584708 RepID=E3D0S2_9BACT|nr:uridine diphosphate-N-acetylglucosamine-binding protein YvcK [Aminomonas paucivorans]EFQ23893.1 protein of unknown function UPF0052 and CofD [Aminomonas paucivorans DSM 12260]
MDPLLGAGLGFFAGAFAAWGTRLLLERERGTRTGGARRQDVMASAIEYRLSMGPRIVAIGGGTGLSTLLSGLKGFTRNLTAVVTVTDEGGSSGRLRQEWGVLPPGDVRNCLVALAENDNALQRILSFRFDRGELAGHSLGNLILLATTELAGDFQRAVEELNKLLAIRGKVLPVTTESVVLVGETNSGLRVKGELDVSAHGSELNRLWLEPRHAEPLSEVLQAIRGAEIIVLGPGSLFTSILPNLLLEKVALEVRAAAAPKIYVANLMTQPGETEGLSLLEHVDWITSVLGSLPDVVVANQAPIPPDILDRYRQQGAQPLRLSAEEERFLNDAGTLVLQGDFVGLQPAGGYLRHHTQRLSEALVRFSRDAKEGGSWRT